MELKRTLRERKFIKAYIENSGNATKAYMVISPGMGRESAAVQGHDMLRTLSKSGLLDSIGITDNYLNQRLKEGLEAVGECYGVRKKYLDIALKLKYPVSEELKKEINGLRDSLFNGLERFFNKITPSNIRYVGDRKLWIKMKKGKRNPDFIIEGQKMVIELFGDYWHEGENTQDIIKEYSDVGYKCLVLWESEIYDETEKAITKVTTFIEGDGNAKRKQSR